MVELGYLAEIAAVAASNCASKLTYCCTSVLPLRLNVSGSLGEPPLGLVREQLQSKTTTPKTPTARTTRLCAPCRFTAAKELNKGLSRNRDSKSASGGLTTMFVRAPRLIFTKSSLALARTRQCGRHDEFPDSTQPTD
jgi:hypothetical protein